MGPANGVMGDSTDLPVTTVPEIQLIEEKNLARFSKSKEFKKLKEYLEARIRFFQSYLPDGKEVRFQAPDGESVQKWLLANNIIAEFQAVINIYENASEVVQAAEKLKNVT